MRVPIRRFRTVSLHGCWVQALASQTSAHTAYRLAILHPSGAACVHPGPKCRMQGLDSQHKQE